jgi:hypothetical protein
MTWKKGKLVFMADDVMSGEPTEHEISAEDLIRYYATQAPNIYSGCRTLGTIVGDWRPVDYIARECLERFKRRGGRPLARLKAEAHKWGLIPQF